MSDEKIEFYQTREVRPPNAPLLTICNAAGQAVVVIACDGSVRYGTGVNLDEVSRAFWEGVGLAAPGSGMYRLTR